MEPRGALQSIWSRRESLITPSDSFDGGGEPLLKFHPEPTVPIHPALEYEVVAPEENAEIVQPTSSSSLPQQQQQQQIFNNGQQQTKEENAARRRNRDDEARTKAMMLLDDKPSNRQWKLFVSFFFLIASGVGAVVSAKLQAIPM